MIKLPKDKVAIVPVFDSDETKGGIIKPSSFVYEREIEIYEIFDASRMKKLDEAEDKKRAIDLCRRYREKGYSAYHKKKKSKQEDQPLAAGERCDQGVIKYVGSNVSQLEIGDYVFFSGYTGTLVDIEGEGRLIILPERFIECTFDIEKFHKVPGLYFKSKDGMYFNATFEEGMNIISRSFTDLGLNVDIKSRKPDYEEYNFNENN